MGVLENHIAEEIFQRVSQGSFQEMVGQGRDTLAPYGDGEIFLEYRQSSQLVWEGDQLKMCSSKVRQGMGVRGILGAQTHFVHDSQISLSALQAARKVLSDMSLEEEASHALSPPKFVDVAYYDVHNPLEAFSLPEQIKTLQQSTQYAQQKEAMLLSAQCRLSLEWQVVAIIRRDSEVIFDIRPLCRWDSLMTLQNKQRTETGMGSYGGRYPLSQLLEENRRYQAVDEALRQARVNLSSVPMEAGTMDVVLGPGWPAVLLHEAIGHGLEADHIRKKSSVYSDFLGKSIASDIVSVVDDGTIADARGSLSVDDEGTPTQKTLLIDKGRLVNFMYDRQNAALMGVSSTGNGRRQDYASLPLPRMLNTYMLAGKQSPQHILNSVEKGIYAVHFGGGQVNTTTGQFVFDCTEAYEIVKGKVGRPLKNATITGIGAEALKGIVAVGNDLSLDPGVGSCGKAGQVVPVGVGQPTLCIKGLVVGGTGES